MGDLARRVGEALEAKQRAMEGLAALLSPGERRRAERDHHARRRPRPCGITIHTGVGCSYGCVYCYIWDMGFPGRPEPYPLSPPGIAYALAVNPYIVPGYTFAAYGSVTEPFLPETRELAVEYIGWVYRWLRLPSQVSTKTVIDSGLARSLKEAEPRLSVLVTVVALGEWARRLEPGAPSPEDRIRAAGEAARMGLSVALFIRPIIPGVTDAQAPRILEFARESGVRGVVLGSLRVTPGILSRLRAAGVEIPRGRIPRAPRGPRDQVTILEGDLKEKIREAAERLGLRVYPTACSANVDSHVMPCHRCRYGPCYGEPERPDESDASEALEVLGVRAARVEVRGPVIHVWAPRGGRRVSVALHWLREVSGLMIRLHR